MRPIDADALLENYNLKDAKKYGNKNREEQEHSYNTLMMYEVADMIEDAPTIDLPGKWIPCKERMPVLNVEDKSIDRKQSFERDGYLFPFDIGKEFLVTDKYGHVHPSTFWLIEKAFDDVNAIAWMEKPEPYKEEDHEQTETD